MSVLTLLGRLEAGLLPMLQAASPGEDFVPLPPAGENIPAAEVLVTMSPDPDDLDRALTAGVRWVHVLATGVDRFPLDRVGDHILTCSRGASAIAISEFVLASMLAAEKQLPHVWVSEPTKQSAMPLLGSLAGKTAGIIGFGAIGREVARRALAFDMSVLAVRRTNAPAGMPGVTLANDLASLLGQSDHVVVTAPATAASRHLIGAEALAGIKRGAHFVNVSRGAVVDHDALLGALDDGRIATATLDVTEPEPLPAGHPLYAHPKARVSPHISWSSPDTMTITVQMFGDNLRHWRGGDPLEGIVDVAEGY